MTKFIGIVLLFPLMASAFSLPAHFGTSISLKGISPPVDSWKEISDIFDEGWTVDLQISNIKFRDGDIEVITHAEIGKEHANAGASLFFKVSRNLWIGGMASVQTRLDTDYALTGLFSVPYEGVYVEPFVLFYLKSQRTAGAGIRLFKPKLGAVSVGYQRMSEYNTVFVMLTAPIEANLEQLFSFFDYKEDKKEE